MFSTTNFLKKLIFSINIDHGLWTVYVSTLLSKGSTNATMDARSVRTRNPYSVSFRFLNTPTTVCSTEFFFLIRPSFNRNFLEDVQRAWVRFLYATSFVERPERLLERQNMKRQYPKRQTQKRWYPKKVKVKIWNGENCNGRIINWNCIITETYNNRKTFCPNSKLVREYSIGNVFTPKIICPLRKYHIITDSFYGKGYKDTQRRGVSYNLYVF